MLQNTQRRCRIKYQARLAALAADQLQGAINMLTGFRMEGNVGGARRCKIRNNAVDRLDHEMNINRGGDAVLAQRGAYQRANGQIGDVMVIHHIKVHDIGARGEHVVDFFTQAGKVSRENRRRNKIFFHRHNTCLR